jgi:uncharacterized protein (DUF1499 family)
MNAHGRTVSLVALALGVLGLLVLLSAGPGTRLGLWHFRTGLGFLRYASYLGIGAALLGLVGLAMGGARGMAAAAVLAAIAPIAVPVQFMRTVKALPMIHDITTDPEDPPSFSAVLPARGTTSNPVAYAGAELAAQQRAAYPDIQPLRLPDPPGPALARASSAARALGWEIVSEDPGRGYLEATDTTTWFGFKDDVAVRVRAEGTGSRIDVRSTSRVGKSDVGANARRIRRFLDALRR